MTKENTTPLPDESIIAFTTLHNSFELKDEIIDFIKNKGYKVELDSRDVQDEEYPRLHILIREEI